MGSGVGPLRGTFCRKSSICTGGPIHGHVYAPGMPLRAAHGRPKLSGRRRTGRDVSRSSLGAIHDDRRDAAQVQVLPAPGRYDEPTDLGYCRLVGFASGIPRPPVRTDGKLRPTSGMALRGLIAVSRNVQAPDRHRQRPPPLRPHGNDRAQLRPSFCAGAHACRHAGSRCFRSKYRTDCRSGFPASWFRHAKLSPAGRNPKLNYFGVNARHPLSGAAGVGSIRTIRGHGFRGIAAITWAAAFLKRTRARSNGRRPCDVIVPRSAPTASRADPYCRPRQRQALLHWAYDSRKI